MTLRGIRKIAGVLLSLALLLAGLWIVVANRHQVVSLNLLFVEFANVNMGLQVLITFSLGIVFGLVAAVFLFRLLPLRWQVRQMRKELDELRRQNARAPRSS